MKSNFSEGFAPLTASLQDEIRKFSGRTGTNVGRDKKKTASIRFRRFYAEALEKAAADDTGMAGQVRVSAPRPPKPPGEKGAKANAPRVPGVSTPKVPVPTATGIDKVAEPPARYNKIQNRALRKSAVDNWNRSQKVDKWQQKNPGEGVFEPAGQPQRVKPTDPTNPMGAPAPYNTPAPSTGAKHPPARNLKPLQNKAMDTGVRANAADMFSQMDSMGKTQ